MKLIVGIRHPFYIIDPEFWVMQKMRKSKLPHLIVNICLLHRIIPYLFVICNIHRYKQLASLGFLFVIVIAIGRLISNKLLVVSVCCSLRQSG
jgi:hypothetical protein